MPQKSNMWKFFKKIDKVQASCMICFKTIKSNGNTTNLKKHLKKHPHVDINDIDNEKAKCQAESEALSKTKNEQSNRKISYFMNAPSTSSSFSTLLELEESSSVSASAVSISSSPIQMQQAIMDPQPCAELEPKQQTNKIEILLPSTPTSRTSTKTNTSKLAYAFEKMRSISFGGSRHSEITNALLYFISVDNRPFSIVEGRGFQRLFKEVIPSYKIPSVKYLKAKLDEKYEVLKNIYVEKFELSVQFFCITTDIWTECMTTKSFIGITAHYIEKSLEEGHQLMSICIGVQELSEQHTACYIKEKLDLVLDSWKISKDKIVIAVTDNGANIVKAINLLIGKNRHIPCFAHTINLVADYVLKEATCQLILEKVRNVVKYVKQSVNVSDELRKSQYKTGIAEGQCKKLILDVRTRWNSAFYMIERFLELINILNEIIFDKPQAPILSALEIKKIKMLLELLRPLEFVTKETSAEKYITISKIIPLISCMNKQYQEMNFDIDEMKNLKDFIEEEIQKRFGQIEHCIPIAVATILDPRFKTIHFRDPQAVARAMS